MRPVGSRFQPKACTLACASRRPAYMLVKVRDDDTLEGAHSFVALFEGISPTLRHFLGTLTEMGSIH